MGVKVGIPDNGYNRVDEAAKGFVNGYKAGLGDPVTGTITGAIGAIGGALGDVFGIGKTKYTGAVGVSGDTSGQRVSNSQYKNYNTAADYLNNYYNTLPNNQQKVNAGSGWGIDTWKKRGWGGSDKYWMPYWTVNTNTGNNVMNDYINSGLGNWNTYLNNQSNAFNTYYKNMADKSYDENADRILSSYGAAGQQNFVNQNDSSQYADAKKQLDNQLARGYLSDVGYQQALNKLNNQVATNKANLAQLASNQYNTWSDDLAQLWAKNTLSADNGLDSNSWIKNYDAWKGYNGQDFNDLYSDAVDAMNNYQTQFISDDLMNAALNPYSLYNPDEYIAWGSANQGQFNPYLDFNANKKRPTLDNIGEV